MFPQIFGKYVLERELAAGGMARVYLATLRGAVGFEKRLVVKQIRPELASDAAFVKRFVEEAKTAVELSHPNIVQVYELGVEQGVYYIAMEFCVGLTLAEILTATGKLSPEEGALIGVEICRALDYAHRRSGIVHRDVTPRNVLIDEEGAVRLIDFGIAAPVDRLGDGAEIFGSPGHMPPEQIAGQRLTPAADVFALAVLLVETWTGVPPFRRATVKASRESLLETVPRLDVDEPRLAPLADVVERCLERDPARRPDQAEALGRPLRDFVRSVDGREIARKLGERVQRARRVQATGGEERLSGEPPEPRTPGAQTRTFAIRNEVAEWTSRSESPPAPIPSESRSVEGPSTRKIVSTAPPDGSSASESSPSESGLAKTPVSSPAESRRAYASSRRRVALVAVLATLVVAVLLALRPPADPGAPRAARDRSFELAAAPSAVPDARPAAAPLPERIVAATVPAASSAPATTPSAPDTGGGKPTAPAAARSANPVDATAPGGVLRLTADPPAQVSVRGAGVSRSFATPVREVRLPPGAYTVTFQSSTYAGPVVTRVVVDRGGRQSVHADFREAIPRVTVR